MDHFQKGLPSRWGGGPRQGKGGGTPPPWGRRFGRNEEKKKGRKEEGKKEGKEDQKKGG